MRVLVTGGAGYIGSVVTEELIRAGHQAVVYDNLSRGHRRGVAREAAFVFGDTLETDSLVTALASHQIEAVIHMAADALVGESVSDPSKYYRNNLTGGISVLEAIRRAAVKRIVFSSTCAVYGQPERLPIEETAPNLPSNPYGETKLALERAMKWYGEAYGIRVVSLRYFNAAGATALCGEDHEPETHLIPLVLQAAAGMREAVEVYGSDYATRDGTCVRDYIHVVDLANAHLLALEKTGGASAVYNLGCGGEGYTVMEVIRAAEEVTGRKVPFRTGNRRPGDPASLIASSEKIKRELGWKPALQDLHTIIESAWRWTLAHPQGHAE